MRASPILALALLGCHAAASPSSLRLGGTIAVAGEADASGLVVSAVGPAVRTTTTAPDGRFSFEGLAAGHYRVIAIVPATRERRAEREVDLTADAMLDALPFTPTGAISGRLVGDQAPVAAALVGVQGQLEETTSDPSGRFALEGVPTGKHTLFIARAGFVPDLIADVEVRWRQATLLGDRPLATDPTDLSTLAIEATVVGLSDATGLVGKITPGEVTAQSTPDGHLVLAPLQPGLYTLLLTHPVGTMTVPRLFFGNGKAFVIDRGLVPLGPLRLNWGRRVSDLPIWSSPTGRYGVVNQSVFELSGTPTLRFDAAAHGLLDVEYLGFVDDETWLVVKARAADGKRRALYRVAPGAWEPEWMRDVDEPYATLYAKRRAVLFGDRPEETKREVAAQLLQLDDLAVLPIGEVLPHALHLSKPSASGALVAMPAEPRWRVVRLADAVTIGFASAGPGVSIWWHPDHDLLVFGAAGDYRSLDASGTEIAFGAAGPSGPGWFWSPSGFGPTNGIRTADRKSAYGVSGHAVVRWDVATGASTELDGSCPVPPTVLRLFDGERRLATLCTQDGLSQLRLIDLVASTASDLDAADDVLVAKDRLVYRSADALRSAAFDGSGKQTLLEHVSSIATHPDGQAVCARRSNGDLFIVDTHGGQATQIAESSYQGRFLTPTLLEYSHSYGALPTYSKGYYLVEVSP